jgi:hypothetical protein
MFSRLALLVLIYTTAEDSGLPNYACIEYFFAYTSSRQYSHIDQQYTAYKRRTSTTITASSENITSSNAAVWAAPWDVSLAYRWMFFLDIAFTLLLVVHST